MKNLKLIVSIMVIAALIALIVYFAIPRGKPTPGYNQAIPSTIITPPQVDTRLGKLTFKDGVPDEATVTKVYDNLDFLRGVEVFLNFIPAASLESIRTGLYSIGAKNSNQCVVFDKLMDSNSLFLTGNTDTVYASCVLDLQRDGATVVEVPARAGPGTVDDAFFRFVTDMGMPGPDRGEGGKYLILPPDYQGDLNPPAGGMEADVDGEHYFVAKSKSYVNWLILRGFLQDGKPDAAAKMWRQGLKVYPLSQKDNPPSMKFISGSNKVFNTIYSNTFNFYNDIDQVLQREPIDFITPELRGLAASIGLIKGKPFKPNARLKKILVDAVAVGNATARAIWLHPRNPNVYFYKNSGWYTAFNDGNYQWLRDDGQGGRNLDARTMFFYIATVNTPAMEKKMVGKGSQYALNSTDKAGHFLDGSQTYKLTLPKNIPAKNFWSVVVYDPQTRSELQTSQPFPSKNSKKDDLQINPDGSVDIYFSPSPPKGKQSNWIQTVPSKGWFVVLRLYGPLEPWFNKTWRPSEIEQFNVKQ